MRNLLCVAFVLVLMACGSSVSPEEQAARAAQSYYQQLAEGNAEAFLDGRQGADSMPQAYREQLVAANRQYLADMKRLHGGLCAVGISGNVARTDSLQRLTYAFLLLTFNDSTREEITVPMVLSAEGQWRMK